jgi:hypothetical protein
MKIMSCLPLILIPLVAACEPQQQAPPQPQIDCVPGTHITITPDNAKVDAAPKHICVHKGDTITVTVAGPPMKGSVSTTPKVGKNTWLNGSNGSNAMKFELFVNDKVVAATYKYKVNTQNGAVLDPWVTVKE